MISENDVKYVASLSRIHLKKEEIHHLTKDLERILEHINTLSKLNVEAVAPTSHAVALRNVYREDKVEGSFSNKQALSVSVESHNGFFKVPKVIE